ncbi:MAG: PepSY domain-containing protein [Rhodococcus sp.]|nr:PepSY domain-containing protein [Rhodococcus sp. (in: high G+C Gram-positive bacteria)]
MSVPELERDKTEPRSTPSSFTERSRPSFSLRPLVMRMHFYAGILVAPFLVLATISGGLYAMAPTIEQIVYRDYLHVDSTGPAVPVSEQVRAAQDVRPDLTVTAVRPAAEPGETTRVLFDDPSLGESERLAVFIDPVTAQSTGELVSYGSAAALPVRAWISQLHRNLHLGEPGRIYSELAASWLWVIALGGVYLWVARYRAARRRSRSTAGLWTVDRSSRGRRRTLSWHGVAGIWIAAALVFLSTTGLTWSKYAGENIGEVRSALSWTTPTIDTTLTDATPKAAKAAKAGHEGHGASSEHTADPSMVDGNIDRLDAVLDVARANGVTGAVEAAIPSDVATAFTVEQTRQPWQFSAGKIAVDGRHGDVTDASPFSEWPLAAKLTTWGIALHMGILFGLVSQVALVVLAAALMSVIIRGYVLWWRRRPTRGTQRMGRAPMRGTLRGVHPAATIAVVVGVVAVGYAIPLLGMSLAAFLVVDYLAGVVSRTRGTKPAPGH